jgi:hypothetical protein
MNTQSHTPGPWVKRRSSSGRSFEVGPVAIKSDSDREQIASCIFGVGNARLIEAAPDLLAACKRMLRAHDEGWKNLDFPPIEDIRAAVAIAEGAGKAVES